MVDDHAHWSPEDGPKPFDAGDKGQVKKRKKKIDILREQDNEDLRNVLLSPGGRRFIWKLLEECGVYKISFTGNSHTFFNEGKRQIGLRLIEDIFNAAPNAYTEMRMEAASRKEGKLDG